jgi:ATP-dependent DNA helicase RecQ
VDESFFDYPDPVNTVCREVFGLPYTFPWQRLIIASVLDAISVRKMTPDAIREDHQPLRQIAVLPTGAGKSLCWMLPAVMISGITVAVFPLLSLMADQERRLKAAGIKSVTLRGGQSPDEKKVIWQALENGSTRVVLANPEILGTSRVAERLGALKPEFLVIDETHTVSQWGETFRPACAAMGAIVEEWAPPAVLALTATAGPHIRERITSLLFNGTSPTMALADPDRPAIRYGALPALSRNHILEYLVRSCQRPLIVFGPTRSSVMMAARMLRFRLKDDKIRYYHAGLTREEKARLETWFLHSRDGVLCATCAYGLGVDKSDIRTVVHLAPPGSVEAYLQESGRASRDGMGADAWLIWTPEIQKELGEKLSTAGTCSSAGSPAETAALFRRHGMLRYASSSHRCRREMLLEALGTESSDCTGCDVCGSHPWIRPPEQESIQKTVRWNRGRFRKGQLARILIGRRSAEIRRAGLDALRGFGILRGWELEDAEEAIEALIRTGELRFGRWGPRKGRLMPGVKVRLCTSTG